MEMEYLTIGISLIVCFIISITFKKLLLNYSYKSCKNASLLKGKTAVITGGGSGLGKACAKILHSYGCNIIVCGRTASTLELVCTELMDSACNSNQYCRFYCMDLSQFDNICDTTEKILQDCDGKVDILINNAGVRFRGNILSTETSVFEKVFATNFFGQVTITKAILPSMINAKSGHIVGIGSVQVSSIEMYNL